MRRIMIWVLSASLMSFVSLAAATLEEPFKSWNEPVAPFRIIANIYYVGATETAAYLITTDDGHILLDGGFAETAPLIRDSVRSLGFDLNDVKILLNSHAHFDHAGGLAALKRWTGADLHIMEGDVAAIRSGAKKHADQEPDFSFPPVEVDRVLSDGAEVTLGGTRLVAHLTPGHTKGCTTWTMDISPPPERLRVVFVGSPNLLPGVPLVGNPEYPEIAEDFARTFRVLKEIDADVFLGSHASFFRMKSKADEVGRGEGPNPFIDRKGYLAFVEGKEKKFREALEAQRRGREP